MRYLIITVFAIIVVPAMASMNDTGLTLCLTDDWKKMQACSHANSGEESAYPRQDGRFGRDAMAVAGKLEKTGAGAAGFDFTPMDVNGHPIAIENGKPIQKPRCVRDNVTSLTWEVKTPDNMEDVYSFRNPPNDSQSVLHYVAQTNRDGLCGHNNGWRLPTRGELTSIVHHGVREPTIDTMFFPNTIPRGLYWTSDPVANAPDDYVWALLFSWGDTVTRSRSFLLHVRLVRD